MVITIDELCIEWKLIKIMGEIIPILQRNKKRKLKSSTSNCYTVVVIYIVELEWLAFYKCVDLLSSLVLV